MELVICTLADIHSNYIHLGIIYIAAQDWLLFR